MVFFGPGNFFMILFLTAYAGIPPALVATGLYLILKQVPIQKIRWAVPVLIVVLLLAINWAFFSRLETPESYQQNALFSFVSGLLLHGSLILIPVYAFEHYFRRFNPAVVVFVTGIVAIFVLTMIGLVGRELAFSGDVEFQIRLNTIIFNGALIGVSTVVYAGIACLDTTY
jgi:FlaA1/EpsC-like NDP-sugar epimerase